VFDTDEITEGVKLIEQGMRRLATGPLDYNLKKLVKARELLLTRFAPFKVGDRVTLAKELYVAPDSGWIFCKHFLVPGSVGRVKDSDCDADGRLRFFIEFENQTWIDREGVEQPMDKKSLFCLFEDQLVLA
jgi:hypothetical protein